MVMAGGVAVASNLLCVAWSGARGRVFLFDLEERRPMSFWDLTARGEAWSEGGEPVIEKPILLDSESIGTLVLESDRALLASVLRAIGQRTTSSNVRSWCHTRALELEGVLDLSRHRTHRFADDRVGFSRTGTEL